MHMCFNASRLCWLSTYRLPYVITLVFNAFAHKYIAYKLLAVFTIAESVAV